MRRNQLWLNIDWITVLIYLFLLISGWVNVYSASYSEGNVGILNLDFYYGKQMLWIGFSLIIAFFILVVDSKFFVSFSIFIYLALVLLLVLVLFIGQEVNGAKSWFEIGGVRLQPAEFAKFGVTLAVAKIVSAFGFRIDSLKSLLKIGLVLIIPIGLIILQNDTGSALVYLVFLIPLFREGLSGLVLFFGVLLAILFIITLVLPPALVLVIMFVIASLVYLIIRRSIKEVLSMVSVWTLFGLLLLAYSLFFKEGPLDLYFILLRSSLLAAISLLIFSLIKRIPQAPLVIGVFIIAIVFTFTVDFVFEKVLEPHQQARINELLGVKSDPYGAGFHVNQSKIAIGSGGLMGKGFLQGTQTKYNFVPEQSTDFIFCTVGEEWGFLGTIMIIFAFMFLIIRLVLVAERQRSIFSRVYGYSVASIIFFHFAINIGMTIGLAPVIGIPLPFFSYGGSSLWVFTVLLFVFLRLDTNRFDQFH